MPQKNTLKEYAPHSYYHVYFRGVNKDKLFLESADYHHFLSLFARYMSAKQAISKTGVVYPNYHKDIKLLAYCLMSNHAHLFLYQLDDAHTLRKLMSSLMTSYSKYFNRKYKRVGSVFESRYKAKRIDDDSYLTHISRYIHMNPRRWQGYRYSSLRYAFNESQPEWLSLNEITKDFKDRVDYLNFLLEYQGNKDALEAIKYQLADM